MNGEAQSDHHENNHEQLVIGHSDHLLGKGGGKAKRHLFPSGGKSETLLVIIACESENVNKQSRPPMRAAGTYLYTEENFSLSVDSRFTQCYNVLRKG